MLAEPNLDTFTGYRVGCEGHPLARVLAEGHHARRRRCSGPATCPLRCWTARLQPCVSAYPGSSCSSPSHPARCSERGTHADAVAVGLDLDQLAVRAGLGLVPAVLDVSGHQAASSMSWRPRRVRLQGRSAGAGRREASGRCASGATGRPFPSARRAGPPGPPGSGSAQAADALTSPLLQSSRSIRSARSSRAVSRFGLDVAGDGLQRARTHQGCGRVRRRSSGRVPAWSPPWSSRSSRPRSRRSWRAR